MKRALIMAGGGTKVAFQAGVLQVWLDEAGLEFDHADGASGGVFNLAMYCQGLSGTEIADNWRNNRPLRGVQPSLNPFVSLFRLDRFRRNTLQEDWGLDWAKIRGTDARGDVQPLQLQHPRSGGGRGRRHGRRPADLGGVAADVVPAGRDRRLAVRRRGDGDRRQPRGGDRPRRRRAVGDLDGRHAGQVAQRVHRPVLPDDRGDGERQAARHAQADRAQQRRRRRRTAQRVRPAHRGQAARGRGAAALPDELHARPHGGGGRARCHSGAPVVRRAGHRVHADRPQAVVVGHERAVHRGDGGLRPCRRQRPGAGASTSGRRRAVQVPSHDRHRRSRFVHRPAAARRHRGRLGRVRRVRRASTGRTRTVQPVRRPGRPDGQAHALRALVHRRPGPPAHARRSQGDHRRPRARPLARHDDAVHDDPRRPRGTVRRWTDGRPSSPPASCASSR